MAKQLANQMEINDEWLVEQMDVPAYRCQRFG